VKDAYRSTDFIADIMISVVIPTHNRKTLLRGCMESLANQSYKDYEVIVVGDGSTDGTEYLIREMQKDLRTLRYFRQEALGHSVARNLGFSKARGEIIASIDDDCVPEPDWLERIDKSFTQRPEIAAVGGVVTNAVDTKLSWTCHILGFSSWLPWTKKRFVRNIPTCNIAYRKESIKGLKFEDDMKSLGYRDSLFNLNVSKQGKILFDPEIRVTHHKKTASLQELLNSQRRQARGFFRGGHKVHKAGALMKYFWPVNLLCPRLLLVFYRCLKSGRSRKFISNFPLILRGEVERVRKHE
jgi:glycosyltransferase involved in cell wall biosynthesis